MAACLHTDGAVASHRAAARLHGLPMIGEPVVEVTARYRHHRNPLGRIHRSIDLRSEDIVLVGPIPTTSVARTAADLFSCLSAGAGRRGSSKGCWVATGSRSDELDAVHARYARQGRPTTVDVRAAPRPTRRGAADAVESSSSAFEPCVLGAGLPEPERQVPLPGWVEHPAHVDFAYVEARLIIEVDGRSWHARTSDFELDRRRDNAAQLAGGWSSASPGGR